MAYPTPGTHRIPQWVHKIDFQPFIAHNGYTFEQQQDGQAEDYRLSCSF